MYVRKRKALISSQLKYRHLEKLYMETYIPFWVFDDDLCCFAQILSLRQKQ